jgi:hypothetical protein
MIHRRLRNYEWRRVIEKFEKNWKGNPVSTGGCLVFLNVVLSNLPIYRMSFFDIPPGVLKKLDTIRSKFFWEGDSHKKKYHLAKWDILCLPKDQGGMGITNLHIKNICLLSKWLYHLLNEGVWQQLLKNKYFCTKSLTQT